VSLLFTALIAAGVTFLAVSRVDAEPKRRPLPEMA
jgi:hypothetical protein